MSRLRWRSGSGVSAAMLGSAMLGAQFVAARAARDALFLTHYEPASLPVMMMASSIVSMGLVVGSWKALRGVAPSTHVPAALAGSAGLLVVLWGFAAAEPALAARIVYLQIAGIGPLLGSGFWLIAGERFDPRTAKHHFGRIAAMGTAGGIVGGVLAERVAAAAGVVSMLPLLAALQVACAWQVRRLARGAPAASSGRRAMTGPPEPSSALRVLAEAPYLRSLAALVLLGTMAAVLVDYAVKVEIKSTFGSGPELARFFSLYYGAVSLLTFLAQAFGARLVLDKLGLGAAAASPSWSLGFGSVLALVHPGLATLLVAHGGEVVARGSLFRAGYELFYTPIAAADKRAVKATIDVGVARAGEIAGAGTVQALITVAATPLLPLLLGAIACSLAAAVVSRALTRGYVHLLEQSLVRRALELDVSEIEDRTTRTAMLRSVRVSIPADHEPGAGQGLEEIAVLRSDDDEAIRAVLGAPTGVADPLVPHVIALLARDRLAEDALHALRRVAEQHVGQFADVLVDPNQPFAVRRRLARAFSVCVSQRAADSLMLGLDDLRFEVRFNCARSLASVGEKNPGVRVDRERVLAIVLREISVSDSVWKGRQLLDGAAQGGEHGSAFEQLIVRRAGESLAHVFTLLGLILPAEPLRLAFFALHTDDEGLRGTALEYLEAVLPPEVRTRLWPFVERKAVPRRPARRREEVLAELMQSNVSIMVNLKTATLAAPARVPPGSTGRSSV